MNVPFITTEPVRLVEFVTAVIALGVAFGAPVSPDQRDAIIAFVIALIPVFELIRSQVTSPATVDRLTGTTS